MATYVRRVSSEEAREGYLFILKDKLRFFPRPETEFGLQHAGEPGTRRTVKVSSYPCTCRGPESPHEHFFITWPGLAQGQKIEIESPAEEGGLYTYRIR